MSSSSSPSPSSSSGFLISNKRALQYHGRPFLHEVPLHVTISPVSSLCSTEAEPAPSHPCSSATSEGAFLGFTAEAGDSRHVFSLGKLRETRFTSIFRFKVWWSTQWVGMNGSDVERETQLLILDTHQKALDDGIKDYPYIALVPIYEGKFVATLEAGEEDSINVCVESGSSKVRESSFTSCVYIHACIDPFMLVKDAMRVIYAHLGTFTLLENKNHLIPPIVNHFGWCTWDAFYLRVDPQGVWDGIKSLTDGGFPPKFVIIDDGWQSISFNHDDPSVDATGYTKAGDQMPCRLSKIQENEKFSGYIKGNLQKKMTKEEEEEEEEEVVCLNGISMDMGATTCNTNVRATENHHDLVRDKYAIDDNHVLICDDHASNNHHDFMYEIHANNSHGTGHVLMHETKGLATPVNAIELSIQPHNCRPRKTKANGSEDGNNESCTGLKAFIGDLKQEFVALEDVYVWHALLGYWGGVRIDAEESFGSVLEQPVRSPGLITTMEDLAVDMLVDDLIGIIPPENAFDFYDRMHSYLAQNGVSGVKLDVIQALEMLSENYGGRVELARKYHGAFAKSLRKNFGGSRAIASMQHCNEFMLLGTEQISLGRVGDDFWPEDKNGTPSLWLQGLHMIHCAYNSLWIGQFIYPDWDMFQTTHPAAYFHAASRAISGGPIYVSDKPGEHDFAVLKQIVFPNGAIPRCSNFALPTRDCLFSDPVHDGMTILKIWNFNKCGGVVGAFNCQGGGWCREKRDMLPSPIHCVPCSTCVSPQDIEWNHGSSFKHDKGSFAMYSKKFDKIFIVDVGESINMTLKPLEYDIVTIAPLLRDIAKDVYFAPIGLRNMMNSGGCVESADLNGNLMKVRGEGQFCVYASCEPKICKLDGDITNFIYNSGDGRVLVEVPWKVEPTILELCF